MKKLRLENTPIVYYIENSAGAFCNGVSGGICGEGGIGGNGSDVSKTEKNGSEREWIVFLHPAFVDHRIFNRQFEYFCGKYNLLAIDLLGHGESLDVKKWDDITKTSEWLFAIFEKHCIPSAHIVGVSLGAVLAQAFAARYENKVLSLALFGGYDINNFDEETAKKNGSKQFGMIIKGLVSIKWFAKANKKISAYTESGQEEFYKLNLGFKKKSFVCLKNLNLLTENSGKVNGRRFPTLIGCGEHDVDGAVKIVDEWAEREGLEKIIFKGAGHCVNLDCADEFNSALERFFESLRKR